MSVWAQYFGIARRDANTRSCWDYTFQLTPEHPTVDEFEKLKFSCDTLADDALARLNEIDPPETPIKPHKATPSDQINSDSKRNDDELPRSRRPEFYAQAASAEEDASALPAHFKPTLEAETKAVPTASAAKPRKRDLYALVQEHAANDEKLGALWRQLTEIPDWVDWEQIKRGQDVFYRYGGPCLTGLAFQSLIGGLGATRVVETLSRTGGFSTPVVRHRLYETTQHVLQVTMSPESLQRGGAGFVSSVRVRLLHAAVRTRIRALAAADPSYFDVSRWGLPISDLDAAATIATFSATIVWLALPRQGIFPTAQETADYIALWRYVGHLVGAPDAPLRDVATSRRYMECLLMREIDPSPTSRALAANTLAGLSYAPPQRSSPDFLYALTHWLNGHRLADALGVPRARWYYTVLVAGQCWGFMLVCYVHRAIPALDRRKVAALRRVFWNVIVTGKTGLGEEAVFEFKYIPQLGKMTAQSRAQRRAGEGGLWAKESGVEWRSLLNLAIGVGLASGIVYTSWKGIGIGHWIHARLMA